MSVPPTAAGVLGWRESTPLQEWDTIMPKFHSSSKPAKNQVFDQVSDMFWAGRRHVADNVRDQMKSRTRSRTDRSISQHVNIDLAGLRRDRDFLSKAGFEQEKSSGI